MDLKIPSAEPKSHRRLTSKVDRPDRLSCHIHQRGFTSRSSQDLARHLNGHSSTCSHVACAFGIMHCLNFRTWRPLDKLRRFKRGSEDRGPASSTTPLGTRLTISVGFESLRGWSADVIKEIDSVKEAFEKRDSGYDFGSKQEKKMEQGSAGQSTSQAQTRIEELRESSEIEGVKDGQADEKDKNDGEPQVQSKLPKGFFKRVFHKRIDSATSTNTIFSDMKIRFLQRYPTIHIGRPNADFDGTNRTGVFQEDLSNTTPDLQQQDWDPLAGHRFSAAEGYRPQSLSSGRSHPPSSSPPLPPTRHPARNQQQEESDDELVFSSYRDLPEGAF